MSGQGNSTSNTGSADSGASGSTGGAGGGGAGDCSSIFEQTVLSSPVREVLAILKRGDVLTLSLAGDKGPLLAITADGQTAGSITSASLAKIIRCITQEGAVFVAIVHAIDGGRCSVEIRPA